jgi:hypothetical protein
LRSRPAQRDEDLAPQETTMTTAHSSKKTADASSTGSATEKPAPATAAAPSPAGGIIFVVPPPPSTTLLPSVPDGFVAVDLTYYRGYIPRQAQLAVMTETVADVKSFTNWTAVFGMTAPSQTTVVQAFETAHAWSSFHSSLLELIAYAASEEAKAWYEIHSMGGQIQTSFASAVKSNAELGSQHTALKRFFAVQSEIAQKGAATKKANRQLEAQGKAPIKGKVGKRRKAAAANALFDAATKPQTPPTPAPIDQPAAGTPTGQTNGGPSR